MNSPLPKSRVKLADSLDVSKMFHPNHFYRLWLFCCFIMFSLWISASKSILPRMFACGAVTAGCTLAAHLCEQSEFLVTCPIISLSSSRSCGKIWRTEGTEGTETASGRQEEWQETSPLQTHQGEGRSGGGGRGDGQEQKSGAISAGELQIHRNISTLGASGCIWRLLWLPWHLQSSSTETIHVSAELWKLDTSNRYSAVLEQTWIVSVLFHVICVTWKKSLSTCLGFYGRDLASPNVLRCWVLLVARSCGIDSQDTVEQRGGW